MMRDARSALPSGTKPTVPRHLRPELGGIGFGGAAIGNLYSEVDDDVAEAAVRFAFEQGIRLLRYRSILRLRA